MAKARIQNEQEADRRKKARINYNITKKNTEQNISKVKNTDLSSKAFEPESALKKRYDDVIFNINPHEKQLAEKIKSGNASDTDKKRFSLYKISAQQNLPKADALVGELKTYSDNFTNILSNGFNSPKEFESVLEHGNQIKDKLGKYVGFSKIYGDDNENYLNLYNDIGNSVDFINSNFRHIAIDGAKKEADKYSDLLKKAVYYGMDSEDVKSEGLSFEEIKKKAEENRTLYEKLKSENQISSRKKAGIGEWFGNSAIAGLSGFNESLAKTLDLFMPTDFLGNYDPFSKLNEYYTEQNESWVKEAKEAASSRGGAYEFLTNYAIIPTVQALPQAVLAMMSGGTSLAASGTINGGTATNGITSMINTATKNPSFWMSFMQGAGNDYEAAKEAGANDFVASSYAILTNILNAGIEIGGGIETLPSAIKNGGGNVLKEYLESLVDEGKEEVIQSLVSNSMAKIMYDDDMKTFSTIGNENALINPSQLTGDFMGGMGAAALLGGGQTAMIKGVEAIENGKSNNVRNLSYAHFKKNGTERANITKFLIDNGISDETELATITNGIMDMAQGKSINKETQAKIKENPLYRGVLYGYTDIKEYSQSKDKSTVLNAESENKELTSEQIISTMDKTFAVVRRGRTGTQIYNDEIGTGSGSFVNDLINDGYSKDEAIRYANSVFKFMYEQGYKGRNIDNAIKAVNELIIPGKDTIAKLFYTAGKIDAANQMSGKKSARVVQNTVLKSMYKAKEISHKTVRSINTLASKLGCDIEFVDSIDGGHNASFDTKTGKLQISRQSKNPFVTAAIHESVHAIRSIDSKSYNELEDITYKVLSQNKTAYKGAWAETYSIYKKEATDSDGKLNMDYISEEMTSEVISQLLTDEDFVNELAKTDRNLVQRIFDIITDFFDKAIGRYTDNKSDMSAEMKEAVKELQNEFDNINKIYNNALSSTELKRGVNMNLPKTGQMIYGDIRHSKAEKEADKIIFSATEKAKTEFSAKVDAWYDGDLSKDDHFNLGDTPFVLKVLGADDLPVVYDMNVMYKMTGGKHSIYKDVIKELPSAINNPIIVFESSQIKGAKVLVTELNDKSGDAVIVAIHLNKYQKRLKINRIASAYGKEHIESFIEKEAENGLLRYVDIKKCQQWSTNRGLQLPKLVQSITDNNNILQKEDIVNTYFMQYGKNNDEFYSKSSTDDAVDDIEPPIKVTMDDISATGFTLRKDIQDKLDKHIEKYGKLEKGVNPVRKVDLPKKTDDDRYVRRGTRTVIESEKVTNEIAEKLTEEIANGEFWTTYERSGNDKARETALATLRQEGFDKMYSNWKDLIGKGKVIDKQDVVNAQLLMEEASKAGNTELVVDIVCDISTEATRAGQIVQSMLMLKKLGTAANVRKIQNVVKSLQNDLNKKFGRKAPDLEIPKDLLDKFAEAFEREHKAGDNDHSASDEITDKIYEAVAKQVPTSWEMKFNTWRYFAMLGNFRTHIRNYFGNLVFMPAIFIKNLTAASLEGSTAAALKLAGKDMKRTKTVRGVLQGTLKQGAYKYAVKDALKIEKVLKGESKYGETDKIMQKVEVYKKLKFLNKWTDTNSKWLEKEDWLFLKGHYARALTMYMNANNLTAENITDKQLEIARKYAIKEAQKATYRDESAMASTLSLMSKRNKGLGIIVDSLLPFKKTPINILKRGIEYSPAGILKALTKGIYDLKKGKITAAEFIDGIAANLTGTGILVLGMFLASQGMLTGPGDDEEDNKIEQLIGVQNYSFKFGDYASYTIDWLSPAAMCLFVGCEMWRALDDDSISFADIGNALPRITEPLFDMSMLEGLTSILGRTSFVDSDAAKVSELFLAVPSNYVGQFVPTILGQTARTIDPVRRKTYINKNSNVPQWVQSFAQQQMKKIPFIHSALEPYINAKGETELNAEGNILLRAFQNYLSPGYYKKIRSNDVDEEISRLYDAEGEDAKGIIPKLVEKSITIDGEKVYLSDEEYTSYQQTTGQTYYNLLDRIVSSSYYNRLSDEMQIDIFEKVKEFSVETGKEAALPQYESDTKWINTAKRMSQSEQAQYMYGRVLAAEDNGNELITNDKFISNEVKMELLNYGWGQSDTPRQRYDDAGLEKYNVSADTFIDVYTKYKSFEEYKNQYGRNISKKKQFCQYLGSLNISNRDKSAIYRAFYDDRTESGKPNIKDVTWNYVWE